MTKAVLSCFGSYEPWHERACLMAYANNKGTDHSLESIKPTVAISKIPRLASICNWAGRFDSCLGWQLRRQVFSWRGSYVTNDLQSVDPDQTAPERAVRSFRLLLIMIMIKLIMVYNVCHSIRTFWMQYSLVNPCILFKFQQFLGVWIFSYFYGWTFLINPYLPSGLFHPYQMDKSIYSFKHSAASDLHLYCLPRWSLKSDDRLIWVNLFRSFKHNKKTKCYSISNYILV